MQLSQNGITLLKGYEGFRKDAYQDSKGIWTIGKTIQKGLTITCDEAEEFFKKQLSIRGQKVEKDANSYNVNLTQSQFDVFLDRYYNFGVNRMQYHGELFKLLKNNASNDQIKKSILVKSDSPGLIARRQAEWILWSTGQNSQDTINRYNAKIKYCGNNVALQNTSSSGSQDQGNTASNQQVDDKVLLDQALKTFQEISSAILSNQSAADSFKNSATSETDGLKDKTTLKTWNVNKI